MARPQFGQPFSPQRPFPLHNKSKVFDRNNNTSGSRFAIPFLLRKSLSQQSKVQKLAQPARWKSSKQRPQINLTFYISYLVESRSFCVARNQFCCSGWWWWTSWTLRQGGSTTWKIEIMALLDLFFFLFFRACCPCRFSRGWCPPGGWSSRVFCVVACVCHFNILSSTWSNNMCRH